MLFFVILLILIIALIFISTVFFKKTFNPISIINFVFSLWLILGRLGLYGQCIPTPESSVFIELNILLLDLFIIVGCFIKVSKNKEKIHKIRFNSELFFKDFRIICLILSLIIFVNMLIGIITGHYSITSIREMSYSTRYGDDAYTKIYFNGFIYVFYQYIVRGFAFFDLTYRFGKLLCRGEKIPIATILNFIFFILIMQSRIEILKVVIFVIIFFLFSSIKLNKKQKKILIRSALVLIIAALATFSVRSISGNNGVLSNSANSLIVDYSGSNYMFSTYYDDHNNGLTLKDSPLVLKYLGGLGLIIERTLAPFGLMFDHSVVNEYLTTGHDIGSSDHYNAFYTVYFEFMNSGGYFGCFLFSIILGTIIGFSYKKRAKSPSLKTIYVATFLTYVAVMGTYNYVLSGIYAFTIVCCILLSNDDTRSIPEGELHG